MKTYWSEGVDGHRYNEETTLTVKELRKILEKYPDDMPVLATWEGILTPFRGFQVFNKHNGETHDYVVVETPEDFSKECQEPCLVFEVDKY